MRAGALGRGQRGRADGASRRRRRPISPHGRRRAGRPPSASRRRAPRSRRRRRSCARAAGATRKPCSAVAAKWNLASVVSQSARDLGHERAEPVGVLLGADDVDAELARRASPSWTQRRITVSRIVDRRHQPRLRIDDQQGAVGGIAEQLIEAPGRARDGDFPPCGRAPVDSRQSASAAAGDTPCSMSAADYRESLRRYRPRVWVDGERVESVADAPRCARHQRAWASATTSRCATTWRR